MFCGPGLPPPVNMSSAFPNDSAPQFTTPPFSNRPNSLNPIAVYHSPDLAPTHHYVAFYRWLDEVWGADAVVHVGKHGTLEWLPGKGVGLSSVKSIVETYSGSIWVESEPGQGSTFHFTINGMHLAQGTPGETRSGLAT